MKHSQLFSAAVIFAVSIYAIIGFYFLPLSDFEGDLTRLAKLPESMFGWTKPQPAIAAELIQQATWQEADVLVIGDSFSKSHIWQTVLTQHGLHVRTEDWRNVHSICEDFSPWLKSQNFKGKFVIIEMVERAAEEVLERSVKCKRMSYRATPEIQLATPETLHDRQLRHYSGKLSVGLQTWLHSLEYSYLSDRPDFKLWELPNHVRMQRILNGCDLFSHLQCQDVLFFTEDRIQDFDETMLHNMDTINSKLKGFHPIWVVVPDKTTSYLNFNKQFWNHAEQRFHTPNLLEVFRREIENKTIDFYQGNDTHLSTKGFLVMGESIRQSMQ